MTLSTGLWLFNGNGTSANLYIDAIDNNSAISGTIDETKLRGFWNSQARTVSFIRYEDRSDPATWQTYTGYLIDTESDDDPVAMIIGHFEAFSLGGGGAARSLFGWCASRGAHTNVRNTDDPVSPIQKWMINSNDAVGCLDITQIDADGIITATVFNQPAVGFWDQQSATIRFIRIIDAADPPTWQVYTGYLITGAPTMFVGYFSAFQNGGGSAAQSQFGWFAEAIGQQPGNLDLVSLWIDENGLLRNPRWWWQVVNPGQVPNPIVLCDYQSWRNSNNSGRALANGCTTQQPVLMSWPWHCGAGHLNWMTVACEGRISWESKSPTWPTGDDDYNLHLQFPWNDQLALTTSQPNGLMVVEFDSDETIDHFGRGWWQNFHNAVDDSDQHARTMINNAFAIVVATLGLDNEYQSWTELHPAFGLAIRVTDAQPIDGDAGHEVWAVFARNSGDQGGCGGNQVIMDLSPNQDGSQATLTFRIPWRRGQTKAEIIDDSSQFYGHPDQQAWWVSYLEGYGLLLNFNVAPINLDDQPFIYGELHLRWS
jgi:hypothetical protein